MKIKTIRQFILLFVGSGFTVAGCDSGNLVTTDPEPDSAAVDISLTIFDKPPPGEAKQIANIVSKTTKLQDLRPGVDQRILRGVHAKAHGCVNAKFKVNEDLNERYQVGLFEKPGKTFDARIRFSNAAVLVDHDLQGGVNRSRGMALKVLDVDIGGAFLSTDRGQRNQDFLMINTTRFAFPTVRSYAFLTNTLLQSTAGADPRPLLALANPAVTAPPGFSDDDRVAVQRTVGIIRNDIQQKTVRNPAQVAYFGAAPFLFGADHVMKFSAAPCVAAEQTPLIGLTEGETPISPASNYLRDALIQSMQADEEFCYNFRIQVRELNDIRAPEEIESASMEWPQEEENYLDVARITIPPHQDVDSPDAQESCEKLVFTPWHSLAVYQPVGGINRLRLGVYRTSATHRQISAE
jgi:hypothetical protein